MGRSPGTGRVSNSPEDSPQGFPVGLGNGFLDSGAIGTMNVRNKNACEPNGTLPGFVVGSLGASHGSPFLVLMRVPLVL